MSNPSRVDHLGTEKIGKLFWEMSSQTTLSLLVYAIYSITDTYFLSVGINSLAAAGASIVSPVLIALGAVATIVGAGGASVVSRALGEENPEKASRTIANTFLIFWSVAITIMVFGVIFIKPIVFLLGATDTIAPYAIQYGRIIFLGALTSTGYSAIVRADGNVRYSTAMWVIPVTVNAFLSWLFIIKLGMDISGAALATVLGQVVSVGMSIYFFFFRKSRSYHIKLAYFNPEWSIIREVLVIGFPSFLKSISQSIVVIVTNNLLKVIGGDTALGVFAIVNRLYFGLSTPQSGMVQGMQPIVGFNFGRKELERVKKTINLGLRSTVAYGVLMSVLCLLIPGALIGLLSKEPSIIAEGESALKLMALAFPVSGVSVMVAAYFQSIGRAKEALLLALGSIILVKVLVLLFASSWFSLTGIWVSGAISDLILGIVSLLMVRQHQAKLDAKWQEAAV